MRGSATAAVARLLTLCALAATLSPFASAAEQCTCPTGGDALKPTCTLSNLAATTGNTCAPTADGSGVVTTTLAFINGAQNTATDLGIAFTNVTTWTGDITVQAPGHQLVNVSTKNAFAMNDTVTVNGDVSISGSNIYVKVLLGKLKHVNGSLTITALGRTTTNASDPAGGFDFEAIDLSALETVSGDLKIHGMPSLTALHLPSLRKAYGSIGGGVGGAMVFTGNHANFTLTLPTCANITTNATALAAMFSKGSAAGVVNVTVAKPKSCTPAAAPTPAPTPAATPKPAPVKSAGGVMVFSVIGGGAVQVELS
jgi:hypothetical protein